MTAAYLSGFALCAALIVAIGAQNAFVLRQGLRREHVGPVVAFCVIADATLIAAGVAGLGASLAGSRGLAAALAISGALYLAAYGAPALRRAARPGGALAATGGAPNTLGAALLAAAGFTLLNPHVYLDTVLLMGAIGAAQPAEGRIPFVLGAASASMFWFTALGYGARLLAPLFARPAAWRVLDAAIGAIMLTLAAGLAHQVLAG